MKSTVVVIVGRAGIGKSQLLAQFKQEHPSALQVIAPARSAELFDKHQADFHSYPAVAVDALSQWNRASLVEGIRALEAQAQEHGGRLLLVARSEADLKRLAISLATQPQVLEVSQERTVELRFNEDTGLFRIKGVAQETCAV